MTSSQTEYVERKKELLEEIMFLSHRLSTLEFRQISKIRHQFLIKTKNELKDILKELTGIDRDITQRYISPNDAHHTAAT